LSRTTFDLGISRFLGIDRLMENLGKYLGFLSQRYADTAVLGNNQWSTPDCNCLNRM